eukprot:147911_1
MNAWYQDAEETFSEWTTLNTEDGLVYYFNTRTNETQWDKPADLLDDEDGETQDEWFWVPHETELWAPATVSTRQGDTVFLVTQDGMELEAKAGDLIPLLHSHLTRLVPDLVLLDDMNEALILHNLSKRFAEDKIYTSIGTILISINPFQWLKLYGPRVIQDYRSKLMDYKDVLPHVYVIANAAYEGLTYKNGTSQSIIISGESGAGKTECTKQCLEYLSVVAGSISGIEKKVLQANPILEGFGNAKTVRNNNSSRFGKYVLIYFTAEHALAGAYTDNYLLESIRVTRQNEGERNYHSFFQLCAGADDALREKLHIKSASEHHFTNQSDITVAGVDDYQEFQEMLEAFQTLDFSQEEVDTILAIVAGIIHLGDILFE